eukprot:11200564-Lingulodinium_polyedra.AAC.1
MAQGRPFSPSGTLAATLLALARTTRAPEATTWPSLAMCGAPWCRLARAVSTSRASATTTTPFARGF